MNDKLGDLMFGATTVTVEYEGRHYITAGKAGFNSPANNASGYATKAKALAAHRYYKEKGAKREAAR